MANLIERHRDRIEGVLSCFDRVLIQGTLPSVGYAEGDVDHDPTPGIKALSKISDSVQEREHRYRGFNFFDDEDQTLFEVLCRGGVLHPGVPQFAPLREHQ